MYLYAAHIVLINILYYNAHKRLESMHSILVTDNRYTYLYISISNTSNTIDFINILTYLE